MVLIVAKVESVIFKEYEMTIRELEKLLKTIKNKGMKIYIDSDQWGCPVKLNGQYELMIDKITGEYITLLIDLDGF